LNSEHFLEIRLVLLANVSSGSRSLLAVAVAVCLSSVCNPRAPYTQAVEIFGNISTALGTLAIH